MKIRGSSWFLIVIMALMLVVLISSLRMEYFESKLGRLMESPCRAAKANIECMELDRHCAF